MTFLAIDFPISIKTHRDLTGLFLKKKKTLSRNFPDRVFLISDERTIF